jgi:hypothetical protein
VVGAVSDGGCSGAVPVVVGGGSLVEVCSGVVCVGAASFCGCSFFFEPVLKSVVEPLPLPIDPPEIRSPAVNAATAMTKPMAAVAATTPSAIRRRGARSVGWR